MKKNHYSPNAMIESVSKPDDLSSSPITYLRCASVIPGLLGDGVQRQWNPEACGSAPSGTQLDRHKKSPPQESRKEMTPKSFSLASTRVLWHYVHMLCTQV